MTHPAVAVYTKSNCQPCRITKRELALRGVEFTEIDLEKDAGAMAYVQSLGHKAAPVVVVATSTQPVHWSGLVPALINEHFGKKAAK